MPNLVNRLTLRELDADFGASDNMVLVSFAGLTVLESESLRVKLAEKGVRLRMVRNSLARRVFAERGIELGGAVLSGNTAVAWGDVEGVIHAAKTFTAPEVKKVGKVKIKAGVLEGRALGSADATAIAAMPDRDTLNAQLLGVISGPARGLVSVLAGLPSGLTRVVKRRADTLGGDAA
jgi:large subunit ribosomal protein L10